MDNRAYNVHTEKDNVDIAPEDDGDIYNTPNTTRVDEEEETPLLPTSTLRLKQVLRNKLDALYHQRKPGFR